MLDIFLLFNNKKIILIIKIILNEYIINNNEMYGNNLELKLFIIGFINGTIILFSNFSLLSSLFISMIILSIKSFVNLSIIIFKKI